MRELGRGFLLVLDGAHTVAVNVLGLEKDVTPFVRLFNPNLLRHSGEHPRIYLQVDT